MSYWASLMLFAAFVFGGGILARDRVAAEVGGSMLMAYALMQIKKLGITGVDAHAYSMAIWAACAGYVASAGLANYGKSLTYAVCTILLSMVGACYLWAFWLGVESGIGMAHSIATDGLAILAMLVAGLGVWRAIFRGLSNVLSVGIRAFTMGGRGNLGRGVTEGSTQAPQVGVHE